MNQNIIRNVCSFLSCICRRVKYYPVPSGPVDAPHQVPWTSAPSATFSNFRSSSFELRELRWQIIFISSLMSKLKLHNFTSCQRWHVCVWYLYFSLAAVSPLALSHRNPQHCESPRASCNDWRSPLLPTKKTSAEHQGLNSCNCVTGIFMSPFSISSAVTL